MTFPVSSAASQAARHAPPPPVDDAARAGARAVIAGETSTQVTAVVHELAGAGASVGIASGDHVEVTVTRPLGGPLGRWGLAARAVARAPAEPGAP